MQIEKSTEKKLTNKKGIIAIVIICSVLAIYLLTSLHFRSKFYFGTSINEFKVGGKSIEKVEEMLSQGDTYVLTLEGKDNKTEVIKGSDISLKYNIDNKVKELKNEQSPFGWILAPFKDKKYQVDLGVEYDEEALNAVFNGLGFLQSENVVEPKDATLEFSNGQFALKDEVMGNKIKQEELFNHVVESIAKEKDAINLEEVDCYEVPKYKSTSNEVADAKNTIDKYMKTSITYNRNNEVVSQVSAETISKWINIDENFHVSINEDEVWNYVRQLGRSYDTIGATRTFATSLGTTVQVVGGSYGWEIDNNAEYEEIVNALNEGATLNKEPEYIRKAASYGANDIGSTYAEINLTTQHIWFYKDGNLVVEGPVVTGNGNTKHATPQGVYSLTYKEKNATLRGENYETPVSFWMPFNQDIGIHDAVWRKAFGGKIYMGNGSHGCVNAPYDVASKIFENIEAGMPVVCYY